MDPIEIVNQRQPVEIIGQRAPVETEPITTPKPEKAEKEEKVKKEKKEDKPKKVYTKDDSCINMPFCESTITQDSNPLWIKIPGVVLGESHKFSYKSAPCTKIWELLNTVIDDLKVTVINYNEEKGIVFFKTGFDVNVDGDVLKNEKYTSFILKSKLIENPFVKN